MTTAALDRDYAVDGMTCEGCARKVAGVLRGIDGVADATVTLVPPRAQLTLKRPVAAEALNAALRTSGAYVLRDQPVSTAPQAEATAPQAEATAPDSLYPLFLIVGYVASVVVLVGVAYPSQATLAALMTNFMAGFFLVFSFFKLLDLRGFVSAYRSYDVVAKAWPPWGAIYPFVELGLGVAYLLRLAPTLTNALTLVVMLVGAVGVLRALLDKRVILCACLGTALKLPMTTVTLVEDLGMAAMAAVMLVIGGH